jgi:carbon monoxide dehydrogenase subunit G
MDMQGQRVLRVTQAQAWDALNNPEILKSCIPGYSTSSGFEGTSRVFKENVDISTCYF